MLLAGTLAAQPRGENPPPQKIDKEGIPGICDGCRSRETLGRRWLLSSVSRWGYGYDSLLADLDRWRSSPYVRIDSVGASVQNRALWELTITSPYQSSLPRRTIFIHARTHPSEVQALYVTREIIRFLIADNDYARMLRERTVFHIIPMYNPDGVELELPRQNAHNIDLERNWEAVPPEPEVATLRRRFQELMASPMPIEIALNMHSASDCKRYFVYHDTAGTSAEFTALEQEFITGVGSFFPGAIEPWSYDVRWTDGRLTNFPESWWWVNHGTKVMALTYEDMNCGAAGSYDSTAQAILRGIALYLKLDQMSGVAAVASPSGSVKLLGNYPNPVRTSTTIRYALPYSVPVQIVLYDLLGQPIATLASEWQAGGEHEVTWITRGAPAGVYLYTLTAGSVTRTGTLTVVR
jgi:hypothetical protein